MEYRFDILLINIGKASCSKLFEFLLLRVTGWKGLKRKIINDQSCLLKPQRNRLINWTKTTSSDNIKILRKIPKKEMMLQKINHDTNLHVSSHAPLTLNEA